MAPPLDLSERKQLRDVAATCLCRQARAAARTLTRHYEGFFAGGPLESTQFHLLLAIRLSEPVSMTGLATHTGLDRTTLTRNLALVRSAGLVTSANSTDARSRLVALTATGRRTLQDALPRWQEAQRQAATLLGPAAVAQLASSLASVSLLNPA